MLASFYVGVRRGNPVFPPAGYSAAGAKRSREQDQTEASVLQSPDHQDRTSWELAGYVFLAR